MIFEEIICEMYNCDLNLKDFSPNFNSTKFKGAIKETESGS